MCPSPPKPIVQQPPQQADQQGTPPSEAQVYQQLGGDDAIKAMIAAGDEPLKPTRPDGLKTCVGCHLRNPSRPSTFPQIVVADHAGDDKCVECHNPHAPKVS